MLRSDDFHSVCVGTALGSYVATRLRVPRSHLRSVGENCENDQEMAFDADQGTLHGHPPCDFHSQGVEADETRIIATAASGCFYHVEKKWQSATLFASP